MNGTPGGGLRVLGPREAALLTAERDILGELREVLASLDADAAGLAAVRQAASDLDDLFMVVVVGEFNAGKSALLNALLAGPYLEEGVTPTTTEITLIRYGEAAVAGSLPDGTLLRTATAPLLRELSIVDTPGTNAIVRRHEEMTRRFIPRSDLVLFVTSVDRPFTESERDFMAHIRAWGKKVIVVLNKIDLLQGTEQLTQVQRFVEQGVQQLLGFTPQVFPVSARQAMSAKGGQLSPAERAAAWQASRFEALERYLVETLDDAERVRLKLLSPLGVAERVVADELAHSDARLATLQADLQGAAEIEGQLAVYHSDLRRDFSRRLQEVEHIVYGLNDRADAFFDETLRLGRVFDLFNADRLRGDFERQVIDDTPSQIDDAIQSMVDWLLDQEQRLWQSVADFVGRRTAARQEGSGERTGALPSESWTFAQERRRMLDSVARAANQALTQYDPDAEGRRWSLAMREAITQTALAGAGALGLGTIVVALMTTAAADVTGILAAGVVAGLGLYIIPLRRRQARAHFRSKTEALRQQLKDGLTRQFETELERSTQRLRDVLAPYSRRVRAEHERLRQGHDRLVAIRDGLAALRARAERELPRTGEDQVATPRPA